MIRAAFVWLATTPLGLYMRDSTNGFAAVEAAHLLGLAVLGGSVVLMALANLRLALTGQPAVATARGLFPIFAASLTAMLATGFLLLASKPLRYFLSDAFRLKMALLALGIGLYLYLDARLKSAEGAPITRALQVASAALLLVWLGVGLAGRFIGLL
jgi:hypothetical protein